MQLRRTPNTHTDFRALTHALDAELAMRYCVYVGMENSVCMQKILKG